VQVKPEHDSIQDPLLNHLQLQDFLVSLWGRSMLFGEEIAVLCEVDLCNQAWLGEDAVREAIKADGINLP
jgi:hypothetical protein